MPFEPTRLQGKGLQRLSKLAGHTPLTGMTRGARKANSSLLMAAVCHRRLNSARVAQTCPFSEGTEQLKAT